MMTEMAESNQKVLAQVVDVLKTGTDVEKGTAAEVLKFVSKDDPDMVVPYIDLLVDHINYKAPRVRWGCPEAIGNMARKHPDKVEKAIPKLLENLEDRSTVVRWCAAFALTEISKYNLKRQRELTSKFQSLIKTEKNNGVRNVYIKALKAMEKQ